MVIVSLCSRQFLYPCFTNWNDLPYRQLWRFICGKNFPGIEVFMLWCFVEKKFIPDNRLQSVCLIPTDTHLFHKETSLWNQWDFRATHQREYENQVGGKFSLWSQIPLSNNKTIHMFTFISSYWQFKTISFWRNQTFAEKIWRDGSVSSLEFLSVFGVKVMHAYRRMLTINWSCFLEGTHFAVTPIQPKFSANLERVEFLVLTFYCLKIAIALQVL